MQENISECIIMPGLKPVAELLLASPEKIEKIYCKKGWQAKDQNNIGLACARHHIPIEFVDVAFLNKLCCKSHHVAHQGIAAQLKKIPLHSGPDLLALAQTSPLPLVLALDQVQDSGNVGTLFRTAYALGCAGIILPEHNSAPINAGLFKASAGTAGKLPCAIVKNLARTLDCADEMGHAIYAASCRDDSLDAFALEWSQPAVLVLGNEQKGIRPGVLKRCAYSVTIPLARSFDSLNIAQAGALLMGLFASWHRRLS